MNIENLKILSAHLKKINRKRFDMYHFMFGGTIDDMKDDKCGTAACIAGHTTMLFGYYKHCGIMSSAEFHLGLTMNKADNLFIPDEYQYERSPYDATAKQAAKVIDHLIETGKVDWNKAR